ncbi:MAG TPA: LamG domain-containing protein [Parafilimonas sp.]|jgi:hypothetical protein|nr:LamG domain-containing protein [Parafilimonas sp.]
MNLNIRSVILVASSALIITSCQKMDRPPLGDYPKDANAPGGPLKFYAAFDEKNVDSVRANFGTFNDASIVDGGVSGKCVQFDGSKNGFINYPSANDFGQSTSFTISFWMNITLAQKDNVNADGVLAVASSTNFWSEVSIWVDHNTTKDTMDLKFHFANGTGDNWDFAGYAGANGLKGMYDGQWHHIAFTYDATSKTGTLYKDGAQFDQKTNETIAFDGNASQLILGGFQEAVGLVSSYSDNSWMSGFPGKMDNVRLYGVALSAADIKSIYDNKE